MKIKIIKVPDGPAPEEIRKQWVGIVIDNAHYSGGIEVNFLNGKKAPQRKHIVVSKSLALSALRRKSAKAARWFEENMPYGMSCLSFGENEVKIIKD